jgi:hypothetical protein
MPQPGECPRWVEGARAAEGLWCPSTGCLPVRRVSFIEGEKSPRNAMVSSLFSSIEGWPGRGRGTSPG